ncbi:MAG TPA: hypothetical protein VKM56_09110, partial [Verrucomicrobiae bacterium]|nr:hypothetical protein [Verrucomicrobiae bacterium]
MKKFPLLWMALLFIIGISVADLAALDWRLPLIGAVILLLLAITLHPLRKHLLAGAIVFAGASALTLRTAVLSPFDIRSLIGTQPQIATVVGRLAETPFQRVYERGNRENWRTIAFINLDTISFGPRTNASAFGTLAV